MAKKLQMRATETQMLFVVECLRSAKGKAEIIKELRERYRISLSRARDIYNESLKYLDTVVVANAQEYKSILLDRLEAQYKDTFLIEDVARRLQRQRELIESMAKVSGVLNSTVNMINIFEYFPDSDTRSAPSISITTQHGLPEAPKVVHSSIRKYIEDKTTEEQ